MMLKVYVGDYFLGKARDVAAADALVTAHACWLASEDGGGRLQATVDFRYVEPGVGIWRGTLEVEEAWRKRVPASAA